MSPKKLSEADKQEILKLYREPEETTSTLASRYNVSSSTISRFLKNSLSEVEYEALIQQKRLARTPGGRAQAVTEPPSQPLAESDQQENSEADPSLEGISRRRRRRSSPASWTPSTLTPEQFTERPEMPEPTEPSQQEQEEEEFSVAARVAEPTDWSLAEAESFSEELEDEEEPGFGALQAMLGEDLLDLDEEELEESEEAEWEGDVEEEAQQARLETAEVQVLPLSSAALPRTCYLVIDRGGELITRPLKDFSDLGRIPGVEVQQRTLPVFDNHRVARRFSNRSQRVIKVPDGQMLKKTSAYLEAKGITRLLIDGQVYSLSSDE